MRDDHPRWLDDGDFAALARARRAPPYDPTTAHADQIGPPSEHRRLFARKFSSAGSGRLLDRIDAELRR